ncbi:MAG: hypothetical protein ACLT98_16730 [Eggerthellaceae bacterium]
MGTCRNHPVGGHAVRRAVPRLVAGGKAPAVHAAGRRGGMRACAARSRSRTSPGWQLGYGAAIALAVAAALGDVCLAGRICARFKIKRALVAVSLPACHRLGSASYAAAPPGDGVCAQPIAAVIVPAFSGTADGTVQTTLRAEGRRRAPPWFAGRRDRRARAGLLVFAFAMAVMHPFNEPDAYPAALAPMPRRCWRTRPAKRSRCEAACTRRSCRSWPWCCWRPPASGIGGQRSGLVSFRPTRCTRWRLSSRWPRYAPSRTRRVLADLVFSTAVLLFCAASFAGQSFAAFDDDSSMWR